MSEYGVQIECESAARLSNKLDKQLSFETTGPKSEVLITEQMLLKAMSWDSRSKKADVIAEAMAKVSHLKLHGQGITSVGDLSHFKNLTVLYLYDNKIRSMKPLLRCTKITHLYLQNNQLESIEMIYSLPLLKKLYLDCNAIARISGLKDCPLLEELHISDQQLPVGSSLEFDDESLLNLGESLKVLIAQTNHIKDIRPLCHLVVLEEINLADNDLNNNADIKEFFEKCTSMRKLSLLGNPICKSSRYVEADAILTCPNLEEFNNKEISEQKRKCIQTMSTRRTKK